MSINTQFTDDQLARLVSGENVSGSVNLESNKIEEKPEPSHAVVSQAEGEGPQVFTAVTRAVIGESPSELRPQIRNSDGSLVTGVSTKITTATGSSRVAYDQQAAERKAAEIEAARLAQQELEAQDPSKLQSEIAYLSRTVKKLQRDLSALKKSEKSDAK